MNFGFARLKLPVKLTLLASFPLVLLTTVLVYHLKNPTGVAPYFLFFVLILLVGYALAAWFFIESLVKGIKSIQMLTEELSVGKRSSNGHSVNLPELNRIIKTIQTVQHTIVQQTDFAEQIKSGNITTTYSLPHENDGLGKALLGIKENLNAIHLEDQQRNWASEGLSKFVQILQSAKNLKELSNDIIINLVRTIGANQGAIFILVGDGDEAVLEMQACYAFARSKHLTQRVTPGEGLIGQVFLEKNTVYLKKVPEQFVRITSGLGEANPRHILIVPLKMNETIVGIVELASFAEFSQYLIEFVEKIGENIAHSVSSFRIAEHTRMLLEESKAQAEEMRAQEEELRQNQEELQATQEAIVRKYDALFKQLGELNYQSKFDQLKSITSTKKRNVEYYFDIIRNQILTFSEDTMVTESVNAFKAAFYKIEDTLAPDKLQTVREAVTSYYANEFIAKLNDNVSRELKVEEYLPSEIRALLFQYTYIAINPHPTGSKSLLDDPMDGSEYARAHAKYHPIFRNFLEKFGYYDIFLIDADTGTMLYSVFKEVDFATNLLKGHYSKTNFGKVVKSALDSTDKNFVQLIDFEPYDPSYHAPASFIASVVYDGDKKIGVLVFQMPINKINQILTGNNKWREDGLGESGETFIVGDDYLLRSISRKLIEDLEGHLSTLKKSKYPNATIQKIRKMQTNILMEEVKTDGIGKALSGITGTALEDNAYGEKILSAYAPLNIPDVHWAIVSTMNEEEASLRIKSLRDENL